MPIDIVETDFHGSCKSWRSQIPFCSPSVFRHTGNDCEPVPGRVSRSSTPSLPLCFLIGRLQPSPQSLLEKAFSFHMSDLMIHLAPVLKPIITYCLLNFTPDTTLP